jgi:hypothetical protein
LSLDSQIFFLSNTPSKVVVCILTDHFPSCPMLGTDDSDELKHAPSHRHM